MAKKRKKKQKSLFDGIRKQLAPPTQKHKNRKKVIQADAVGRKDKHKNKEVE